jgi:hypothetical protein
MPLSPLAGDPSIPADAGVDAVVGCWRGLARLRGEVFQAGLAVAVAVEAAVEPAVVGHVEDVGGDGLPGPLHLLVHDGGRRRRRRRRGLGRGLAGIFGWGLAARRKRLAGEGGVLASPPVLGYLGVPVAGAVAAVPAVPAAGGARCGERWYLDPHLDHVRAASQGIDEGLKVCERVDLPRNEATVVEMHLADGGRCRQGPTVQLKI